MNKELLTTEVQAYIEQKEREDIARFILAGSPFENVQVQELAQQLEGKKRSKVKLPTWYATKNIYYPPRQNIEQTSSEAAAEYKAHLAIGTSLADLTGGLGIDSYFFSKKIDQVTYFEKNPELAAIATHNYSVLNAQNIKVLDADSIHYLKSNTAKYDTIYVDPSRRNDAKGKVILLNDCEPNVPKNLDLLFERSKRIIVKTSPLLDIQAGIDQLKDVIEVHIVAIRDEVKELLFILENDHHEKELSIRCINRTAQQDELISCNYYEAQKTEASFSMPLTYIYEPHAALMKSGLFNWISAHYKLPKLHQHTHLYTAEDPISFPGRGFKVNRKLPYTKKNMLTHYKGAKANISKRNFKESVSQLRNKYKIRDGGTRYLFFMTAKDNKQYILDCSKIQ